MNRRNCLQLAHEKYIPFVPLKMTRRAWPDRELKAPPVWCSVDLRDGNQALIDPMNVREKLELFHTLVDIGVKEIEVGFLRLRDGVRVHPHRPR